MPEQDRLKEGSWIAFVRATDLNKRRRNPTEQAFSGCMGDSERKPLDLLGTLMSYFNELSCHSATLIAANFPQSKKHYQLTLIYQVMVLAFHPRNETLQSAVNRAGHQLLSSAEERAAGLSVERKTDTRIFR